MKRAILLVFLLTGCAGAHRWPNGSVDCFAFFNARCTVTQSGDVDTTGQISEPTWAGVLSSVVTAAGAAYAIGR